MIEPEICIIGFNEVDALKSCIPNLLKTGVPKEKIHFFDGPFEEFPHDKDYSSDGTLEYLDSMGIDVISCGEMTHMEKQNYRFEKFSDKEALLYVDCDEIVEGDWKEFCKNLTKISEKYMLMSWGVPWVDMDLYYTNRSHRTRVFLKPKHWKVEGRHWFFHFRGRRIDMTNDFVVGGLQIFHDSSVRPNFREEQMKTFQKVYTPKEEKQFLKSRNMDLPPDKVQCYKCGCTMGYVFYYDDEDGVPRKKGREINIKCRKHSKHQVLPCPFCHSPEPRRCSRCNNKI